MKNIFDLSEWYNFKIQNIYILYCIIQKNTYNTEENIHVLILYIKDFFESEFIQ